MRKTMIKDMLYATLLEMTKNREFYHRSSISRKHEYDSWKEAGIEQRNLFLDKITIEMLIAEDEEEHIRAKELTLKVLKNGE